MNIVSKSGNISPFIKATSQTVASSIKPLIPPCVVKSENISVVPKPSSVLSYNLSKSLPKRDIKLQHGVPVTTQVRWAHTDLKVPSFDDYRKKSTLDPTSKNANSADERRNFTYFIVGGGSVLGVYSAKTIVTDLISYLSASADVLAMAKIEVKLSEIPEGRNMTFKWRGKPLFIRHRAPSEISAEQAVDVASLRDPQHDSERATNPEWLVVIGVCTHLGCVPIANAGEFGGYYCPCHGSHYDASGRIRKGPAPANLEIPPYEFVGDNLLVVG